MKYFEYNKACQALMTMAAIENVQQKFILATEMCFQYK